MGLISKGSVLYTFAALRAETQIGSLAFSVLPLLLFLQPIMLFYDQRRGREKVEQG